MRMQLATTGAIFEWDKERRIVIARFHSTAETPMSDREHAARKLQAWTGNDPYGGLAIREATARGAAPPSDKPTGDLGFGALAFWAGVFRLSPGGVRIAGIGFEPQHRPRLDEWRTRYDLDLTLFDDEEKARAHLATGQ